MNKDDVRVEEDEGIPVGNLLDEDIIARTKERLRVLKHEVRGFFIPSRIKPLTPIEHRRHCDLSAGGDVRWHGCG